MAESPAPGLGQLHPYPSSAQGPFVLPLLFQTSQDKDPFKFQTQRYSYRLWHRLRSFGVKQSLSFLVWVWFFFLAELKQTSLLSAVTCSRNKWLQSRRAAAGASLPVLDVAPHRHNAGPYLLLSRNRMSWCCLDSMSLLRAILRAGANWNESIFIPSFLPDCPISRKQISALKRQKHTLPKDSFL